MEKSVNGRMVFAQIYLQDMMRVFRQLEHAELGLLMQIFNENCLYQAPLDCDDPKLPRRLGCKSKKTFERHLATLIETEAVLVTNGGIVAAIAVTAIEHFQKNSKHAKSAVASRKDRQKPSAESDNLNQDTVSMQIHEASLSSAEVAHEPASRKVNHGEASVPFDDLIQMLHDAAIRSGHPLLAEALDNEDSKRQVEVWHALGLSDDVIVAKACEVMKKKGEERISSWKYFDLAMQNMARAH